MYVYVILLVENNLFHPNFTILVFFFLKLHVPTDVAVLYKDKFSQNNQQSPEDQSRFFLLLVFVRRDRGRFYLQF